MTIANLSVNRGAMQNPTARPELQLTFTQAHADALDAAAKRLAPELAAWNGGYIQDVELEMCVDSVAELGFWPDAEEACYAAQDSFYDSMRHALRNLWSELGDEAREHLLKIESGSRDSEP